MSKVSKNIKPAAKPQNAARREDDTNGVIMARLVGMFALLCIICTVVFDKSRDMGGAVFPVMSLVALAVFAGLMFYENKLNAKTAVYIIIAAGFILRLNYVIYTPLSETVRVRQHDVFSFGSEKGHCDVFIENADRDLVVKELKRRFEPVSLKGWRNVFNWR